MAMPRNKSETYDNIVRAIAVNLPPGPGFTAGTCVSILPAAAE
jgi:hypothetical protein